MKLTILKALDGPSPQHKFNMIGNKYQIGSLEHQLNTNFTDEERILADQAVDDLKLAGFIQPNYEVITDKGNWLVLTEKGKNGLLQKTLDDLDVALSKIDPVFPSR